MSNSSICEAPWLSTQSSIVWEESLRDRLISLWIKTSKEVADILKISTRALRKDLDKLGMDGYREHGSRSEIFIELTSRWVDFFVKKYGTPVSYQDWVVASVNFLQKREVILFTIFQKKYQLTLVEWTRIKQLYPSFFKRQNPNVPSSNYWVLKEKEDEFLSILAKNRGMKEIKKV